MWVGWRHRDLMRRSRTEPNAAFRFVRRRTAVWVAAVLLTAACDASTPASPTVNPTGATNPNSTSAGPTITKQPDNVSVSAGQAATLTVEASGASPMSYQWHGVQNGAATPIDGATAATWVTPALTVGAVFFVRVANPHGAVDSTHATVTVGTSAPPPPPVSIVRLNDPLGSAVLFPSSHWWNQDISQAPVDPNSNAFITFIGQSRRLHPDFGPPPYGIPYVGVGGSQPRVPVTFVAYGSESDHGAGGVPGYPVPDEARVLPNYIEGGVPGGGSSGDRHLIVVDRDRFLLFELFATRWNASANRWEADSGAIFDLTRNDRRPEGWTSADAAGLAILPGLVKYDESVSGEIAHAFRVTVRSTNGYVWPASHRAGSTPGALPMGARLRLKASKDLSGFPPQLQRIFRAIKTYGLIVADNGSDMYVTGTMDGRWDNNLLNPAFHALTAGDFEVVQLGWR